MDTICALGVDAFLSTRARKDLAAALNALLASPTFPDRRDECDCDGSSEAGHALHGKDRQAGFIRRTVASSEAQRCRLSERAVRLNRRKDCPNGGTDSVSDRCTKSTDSWCESRG